MPGDDLRPRGEQATGDTVAAARHWRGGSGEHNKTTDSDHADVPWAIEMGEWTVPKHGIHLMRHQDTGRRLTLGLLRRGRIGRR